MVDKVSGFVLAGHCSALATSREGGLGALKCEG